MKNFRDDFPFFENVEDIYLDNAATTQKPQAVLDKVMSYYTHYCANIHRGSHELGNRATQEYEDVRTITKEFINAKQSSEILFTKGVTDAINLVASSYVKDCFKTLILTGLEHHSNIIPWQLNGFSLGKNLFVAPMNDDLSVNMQEYEKLLQKHPDSFVSIVHVSNAFGIVNPVDEMIEIAHKYNAKVMIDGAQAVAHIPVDVTKSDADFYAFSSHKMYGPTGVGVLYGKYELLEETIPYQGGGSMIDDVSFESSTYLNPPHRFEAGTQNIAGVIGYGEAVKYISSVGFESIIQHDRELMEYAKEELMKIDGVKLFTDHERVCGNLSFIIEGVHHSDIGTLLDKQHITLRTGHHCALPAMKQLGIEGTVRLSFAIYNTIEEIDSFIVALQKAIGVLK